MVLVLVLPRILLLNLMTRHHTLLPRNIVHVCHSPLRNSRPMVNQSLRIRSRPLSIQPQSRLRFLRLQRPLIPPVIIKANRMACVREKLRVRSR